MLALVLFKFKTSKLINLHVLCKFACPGYLFSYIGKTKRNMFTRNKEHCNNKDSVTHQHLNNCGHYKHKFI